MNKSFWNGFEKKAKVKEKPSWIEEQYGAQRALAMSDKGLESLIRHPKIMKRSLSEMAKSVPIGALGGAGLGAIASKLSKGKLTGGMPPKWAALIGAVLGADAGILYGVNKSEKDTLAEKGITQKYLGLKHEFTPAARKKYIDKYKD